MSVHVDNLLVRQEHHLGLLYTRGRLHYKSRQGIKHIINAYILSKLYDAFHLLFLNEMLFEVIIRKIVPKTIRQSSFFTLMATCLNSNMGTITQKHLPSVRCSHGRHISDRSAPSESETVLNGNFAARRSTLF